jgi:hypothetical protein
MLYNIQKAHNKPMKAQNTSKFTVCFCTEVFNYYLCEKYD